MNQKQWPVDHPEYWIHRWEKSETGFHQDEFEPYLVKYFPKLSPTTVLVPLCGKSRDLVWLAQQGHRVTGVELSPIACEDFFKENYNGKFEKRVQGDFEVYEGGPFTLYCGDFFKLTSKEVNQVSTVYDRAALIALPQDLRSKYVSHLSTLVENLRDQVQLLLIVIEYPQEGIQGPPFSVSETEIRALYKGAFQIEILHHQEEESFSKNPKFEGIRVFENVYLLTKQPIDPR